jgi:hypothetical protein
MSLVAEILARGWENFVARPSGTFGFRFLLQPTIVSLLAVRAGLNDAKEVRPAYFWAALTNAAYRTDLLRGGWKDIRMPFLVAAVIDAIYQVVEHRGIYFLEMVFTAAALGVVPYILVRGPACRIAKLCLRAKGAK